MFFINFSFLLIAFQPFHTVSSITFNIVKCVRAGAVSVSRTSAVKGCHISLRIEL